MKGEAFWVLYEMTLTMVKYIDTTKNISTPHEIKLTVFSRASVGLNTTRLPLTLTSASIEVAKIETHLQNVLALSLLRSISYTMNITQFVWSTNNLF